MAFLISGKTPRLNTQITIHTTTDPEKGITDGSFSSECSTPTSSSSESSKERLDKDIVDWDGLYDPENPVNFSCLAKFTNVGIVSTLTFITQLASSMLAPGVPELMAEFGSSSSLLASFVVSVYVLGFAVGPLVLAPGSELVGRKVIYDICNVGFTVFSAACAVSGNLGMLIVFRFLQGCFGSAPLTNGGGTIADLIVQEKRGGVLALYALGIFLGPVIGPVAGGYLVAAQGWRWVFWVLTIIEGILTVLSFLFLRETYPPVLLKRKTQHLIKKTRNTNLRRKCDNINSHNRPSSQLFIQATVRPTKMLLFSPIVSALSIYGGILYGYQYLMFTTFTSVFQTQYHFPTNSSGLSFLGIGIGALFGLFIIGIISDRIVKAKSKPTPSSPSGGTMKPEYRLPPLLIGALFTPIGLFLYGWAAEYKMHWVVPEIGTALVGVGNVAAFVCIMGYVIDAFGVYAASALAAIMVVRSIMGALLPLAGQRMYDVLGLGWGNSLLGFIAVACIPVPWALLRYGERMRMSFDVRRLE